MVAGRVREGSSFLLVYIREAIVILMRSMFLFRGLVLGQSDELVSRVQVRRALYP